MRVPSGLQSHSEREGRVAGLVLARVAVAAEGARTAEIVRDVAALVGVRGPRERLKSEVERSLPQLSMLGLIEISGPRAVATAAGQGRLRKELAGPDDLSELTWSRLLDQFLLPRMLGIVPATPMAKRAAASAEGLQAAVVVTRLQLLPAVAASPQKLISALAALALERAMGASVREAIGAGASFSPRIARVLASQLLAARRPPANDARLTALLAAELLGVRKSDEATLRAAIALRYLDGGGTHEGAPALARASTSARPQPAVPPDATGVTPRSSPIRSPAERFVPAVLAAAAAVADGWPGNRRALIADAWRAFLAREPSFGLSEGEFKALLVEAHRAGRLSLATADLKDPRRLEDFQASAIAFKNTVWHFVRVDA